MNYRLIPFTDFPLLKSFVHDIYEITTTEEGCSYTTVPNGIIGITIKLQGKTETYESGCWTTSPPQGIYGMIKKPELIRIGSHFREIAIGFKPYFLKLLTAEPIANLTTGGSVDAYAIFPKQVLNKLIDTLHDAQSDQRIAGAVNRFIEQLLHPDRLSRQMAYATELITNRKVDRVNQLAEHLNTSTVTLRKQFQEHIGMSPKDLIRLSRIKASLNSPIAPEDTLTALSYRLGYFDQAHFIHEFKSTIGLAPKAYFSNKQLLFDFYNFGRWKGDSFGLSTVNR